MAVPGRHAQRDGAHPTLYLVFGGLHGDARRGTGELVAISASEEEARQAFRAVRLRLADREGWAELTEVADGGRTRRLSWFGVDRQVRANPLAGLLRQTAAPATTDTARVHRLRRRSLTRWRRAEPVGS